MAETLQKRFGERFPPNSAMKKTLVVKGIEGIILSRKRVFRVSIVFYIFCSSLFSRLSIAFSLSTFLIPTPPL